MLYKIIAVSFLVAGAAQAAIQPYRLDYRQRESIGATQIHLKQDLNNRYPGLNLAIATVVAVDLSAKSFQGNGQAYLAIGGQNVSVANIPGNPQNYLNPNPATFTTVRLGNPTRVNGGTWIANLQGRMKLATATVWIDDHYNTPGPNPGVERVLRLPNQCVGGELCGQAVYNQLIPQNRGVTEIGFSAHDQIGDKQNAAIAVSLVLADGREQLLASYIDVKKAGESYRFNTSGYPARALRIRPLVNDEAMIYNVYVRAIY